MKKLIIASLFAIYFSTPVFSQGFMQASLGLDVIGVEDYDGKQSSFKTFEFQIGNFVNEDFAHAFTVGFSTGLKYKDDLGTMALPSGGEFKAERTYSFNIFSLGYERKIIWFGEFDDLWNVYTTRRFALLLVNSKMEYNDPAVAARYDNDQYSKTGVGINVGVGLGVARKFNKQTYAFMDGTIGANYGGELLNLPFTVSFGVRRLF